MMAMVSGVYASYVVGLAWVSNTLPRPTAKVSDSSFVPSFPFSFESLGVSERQRTEEEGGLLPDKFCALEQGRVLMRKQFDFSFWKMSGCKKNGGKGVGF